jgi:hypothetical protein
MQGNKPYLNFKLNSIIYKFKYLLQNSRKKEVDDKLETTLMYSMALEVTVAS